MYVRKKIILLCLFFIAIALFGATRVNAHDLCFVGPDGECVTPPKDYTITFDSNGGSKVSPITAMAGSPIYEPKPTKTGYYFGGWYRDQDFKQKFTFTTMPSYNLTLYAKWIFDKGGSSFTKSYNYDPFEDGLVKLSLEVKGDVDYIKVYLNDDTEYFIASKGNIDVKGTLFYDSSENVIGSYDNDSENYENTANFKFYYKPEVSGYYYLKVEGGSSFVTGDYSIVIIDTNDLSYDYEENMYVASKIIVWTSTHTNPNSTEPETKSLTLAWTVYAEASVSVEAEAGVIFAKAKTSATVTLGASYTQEENVSFVIEAGTTKRLEFGYHLAVTEGILLYYDMNGNLIYSKEVSAEWSFESYSTSYIIN